jgi:LPXTG-motif cell wall-anchored protein
MVPRGRSRGGLRRLPAALSTAALALSVAPAALAAPPGYGAPAAATYGAAPAKATRASASAASSVSIIDYAFTPGTITVNAGDTVSWTNNGTDADGHTVTGSGLNSPLLHTGNAYSFTFSQPGTFSYACSVHPKMTGSVTVLAKATTPSKSGASKGGGSGNSGSPSSGSSSSAPASGTSSSATPVPSSGSESAAADTPGAAGSHPSLPSTGSDSAALLLAGLVLLGGGLALRARLRRGPA